MFLNVSYWEWAGYIIGTVLVVLVSLPNGMLKRFEKYFSSDHLHQKLSSMEIKQGTLYCHEQGEVRERTLQKEEIAQVINWFNEAKFIDKVSYLKDQPSIKLSLEREGEWITIQPFQGEVLIQWKSSTQESIPYWVLQSDLKHWLMNQ
ncbi:MAG TPA: hypothetical protein DDY49_04580 [Paenibacillaceae bacterium]|nr:hypothetical protein [Paenibacillaceae bacterium]